jgi:hypothetical protein
MSCDASQPAGASTTREAPDGGEVRAASSAKQRLTSDSRATLRISAAWHYCFPYAPSGVFFMLARFVILARVLHNAKSQT